MTAGRLISDRLSNNMIHIKHKSTGNTKISQDITITLIIKIVGIDSASTNKDAKADSPTSLTSHYQLEDAPHPETCNCDYQARKDMAIAKKENHLYPELADRGLLPPYITMEAKIIYNHTDLTATNNKEANHDVLKVYPHTHPGNCYQDSPYGDN